MGSIGTTGFPAPKAADLMGFKDNSGDIQAVSSVNPLPITGTITATNPSVGVNGAAIPADSTQVGGENPSGNLEPLQVDANSNLKVAYQTPAPGAITQAAITVGTTAVRCTVSGSAPVSGRALLMVEPDSGSTAGFWIGGSSVANTGAARGIPLFPGATFSQANDAGDYWIISSAASQTVYIMEQA